MTLGVVDGLGRSKVYWSAMPSFIRFSFMTSGVKNGNMPYVLFYFEMNNGMGKVSMR